MNEPFAGVYCIPNHDRLSGEQQADVDTVRRLDGLFVGMLSDAETVAFERLVSDGMARRSYEGAAGFMGLSKVRLIEP